MKKFYSILMMLIVALTVSAREVSKTTAAPRHLGKTLIAKHELAARGVKTVAPKTASITMDAISILDYGEVFEGVYDYGVTLFNDNDDYYPAVYFDLYVSDTDDISGTYSADDGTIDLMYAMIAVSDEDFDYLSDCNVTVTKVGDAYKFAGSVTCESTGKVYSFSVQAVPEIESAYSYDYEPDQKTTFDFKAGKCSVEDYTDEEGCAYVTLTEGKYTLGLIYIASELPGGKLPAGTYPIDGTGVDGTFAMSVGGDDLYDYGSVLYVDIDEESYDPYYLVSGTVTVAYNEEGLMNIAVNATSAKGSTVKVTYQQNPAPKPGDGAQIVIADYQAPVFTTTDGAFTIEAAKAEAKNEPVYNANGKDLRVYAAGQLTVSAATATMTQIDFAISDQGMKRQAEITPSTGEMSYDMDNSKVYWTGNATEVTFTVGASADYGTENSKAGQFDFTALTISTTDGPAPAKTLQSIAVSDYITELCQGADFSFGGKVTASYDDGTTADVTSKASFTGYDMQTVGNQTVTVSYTEGASTQTATYTLTVTEKPVTPANEFEIVIADYEAPSFTTTDGAFTIEAAKAEAKNEPVYNANGKDLRVYAAGQLTVSAATATMTQIVFAISAQGLKRLTDIIPSTGSVDIDADNATVTWTGNATDVTFTVGDYADYGTESTKAGQFDFTSLTITTDNATAIDTVAGTAPATAMFDLTGRKVVNPVKGSVIVSGGKKFIVR